MRKLLHYGSTLVIAMTGALSLSSPVQAAFVCTRDPNSAVNLRAQPSTRAYSKGSIAYGSWIDTEGPRIYDGARSWVHVNYHGVTGWIATDYLAHSLSRCGYGL